MDLLWDSAKAEAAFRAAAHAVEYVADGQFDSDRLRTQPFTEELRDYCEGKRSRVRGPAKAKKKK
jgi:hypothetical protein